jgi:hypothetical protein
MHHRLAQRFGLQQLRDSEIEQLWRSIGRDNDVRRLQIAMHDQVLVCVLDCGAHGEEQLEALLYVQSPFRDKAIDRSSFDELHHQVGKPGRGHAAIQQARDVGMRQRGQDLAFSPKTI